MANKNDTIALRCAVYKDGDYYTAICLDLDVASFGDTDEEARKQLEEALKLYIDYAVQNNKVDEMILNKLGKNRAITKIKHKKATPFRPILNIKQGELLCC